MSIREALKAIEKRYLSEPVCPYRMPELWVTAEQAKEMYRRGMLVPGDESVRLLMSVADAKELTEFLTTFKGRE